MYINIHANVTGGGTGTTLNVQGSVAAGAGIAFYLTTFWVSIKTWVSAFHSEAIASAKSTSMGAGGGETGSNQNEPPVYNTYFYNRWGTLIKTEQNKQRDKVFIANDDDNFGFTGYDPEFVKRFIAVVVGEASSREDAAGIGVVIMNRFDAKKDAGNEVRKDVNWPAHLGGEEEYDAIGAGPGHPYDEVMKTPTDEIFRIGLREGYKETMEGALSALSKKTRTDVNSWLGTPHFWEGKLPYDRDLKAGKSTFFTTNIKLNMIYFSGQAGGSYFFNYTKKDSYLNNRKWP